VAGGSILQGVLKLGDEVEVRPGIVSKDAEGKLKCVPIFSRVVSLFAENNSLNFAVPGGLIGVVRGEGKRIDHARSTTCIACMSWGMRACVLDRARVRSRFRAVTQFIGADERMFVAVSARWQGTKIDPMLTRDDRLVGQVLGLRGQLPQVSEPTLEAGRWTGWGRD
jgi:hypothetical protein